MSSRRHFGYLPDLPRFGLVLGVVFLLATSTGWAQGSAIQGVVSDESRGVIPGVEISVTNLETGAARQTVTDDSGFYSVPLLKEGRYQVTSPW